MNQKRCEAKISLQYWNQEMMNLYKSQENNNQENSSRLSVNQIQSNKNNSLCLYGNNSSSQHNKKRDHRFIAELIMKKSNRTKNHLPNYNTVQFSHKKQFRKHLLEKISDSIHHKKNNSSKKKLQQDIDNPEKSFLNLVPYKSKNILGLIKLEKSLEDFNRFDFLTQDKIDPKGQKLNISQYQPFSYFLKGKKKQAFNPEFKNKNFLKLDSSLDDKVQMNPEIDQISKVQTLEKHVLSLNQTQCTRNSDKNQKKHEKASKISSSANFLRQGNYSKLKPLNNSLNKIIKNIQFPKIIETHVNIKTLDEYRKNNRYKQLPLLYLQQYELKTIASQSYLVIEAQSSMILIGCKASFQFQIASLTKIMTFYVVMKIIQENNINPKQQQIIIIQKCINIGGTTADLYVGQIYTVEQLLYGLMLPSGNDAALALGHWAGKILNQGQKGFDICIELFVAKMNKSATELNLIETKFANPHGLPNQNNFSSALDIARLSQKCMNIQLFRKVVSTKCYKCLVNTIDGRKRINIWQNTNKLLRRQGFIGLKTGITITAGPCLASAYRFKNHTYICVVLRAKKVSRRFKDTRKLLFRCLSDIYNKDLTIQQQQILKRLKRNNAQMDSDYSQDECQFTYDKQKMTSKEYKKRCEIISEM